MKPILMVVRDVQRYLETRHLAEILGFDTNDLANALLRSLHDDGVTDTAGLMRWVDELLGKAGICLVLKDLQLEFNPNDAKEILLKIWFSYRGIDALPQPGVWPNELAENLTEIALQVAASPAKLDAFRLMGDPLTALLRYILLFYAYELRRNGRLALQGEDGSQVAELLGDLNLSELCAHLKCDAPLRASPYDPASNQMIILSDEAACASLSRLADLAGEVSLLSPDQTREFSDCLLAILRAWHGDNQYTPKACTVAEAKETGFGSKLTCYDEMGRTIIIGVESPLTYGKDVLVRTTDKGNIWAPELQVVPDADAWKTPEIGSRKGRTVKMPARDQVFISYSHKDFKWLEELQTQLEPYVRNAKIKVWDDTKIRAGANWRYDITQALESAKVAVLLVSPNFLASKFITDKELPSILEAAKSEGVTILWVPVRSSSFEETPIEAYQAAHPPERPLASMTTAARDKAFVEICKQIQQEYRR